MSHGTDFDPSAPAPEWLARSPVPGGKHRGTPVRREDMASPVYAALDLGTNNCRLLVARPQGEGFRVVDSFSRIVRLGEGIAHHGRLSTTGMDRAVEALKICQDKMAARGVTRARIVATEACRAAANVEEFRGRVAAEAGLLLEVIGQETEAELAATGCTPLIEAQAEGAILFDIGGGSSEIVKLGRSDEDGVGPPRPNIRGWASFSVGVVTLAERFGGKEVSETSYAAMVDYVAGLIQEFAERHRSDLGQFHLLGTSGTVTTIAGVHLSLTRYDRRRVDGCWMSDAEIDATVEKLLRMSFAQRVANACIGPDRADLVLAGCAILDAIRRFFPSPRLRIADRGLREGILIQLMRADGVWRASEAAS